jgi:hypothetical protein
MKIIIDEDEIIKIVSEYLCNKLKYSVDEKNLMFKLTDTSGDRSYL